ncbi:cobalamin-dependent protein [Eubacterium callanderi]|uniref:cobalamin B12-binding domain-containing protein n=1 Tax=Eubacterium callanderi TaxID=53442 RepID=UPI001C2DD14B|nr:cobalamin-dependent protein [Eubacterium callanderi]MBV1684105.1 cobalamin-dependent protein [Eubacterium callanderi]
MDNILATAISELNEEKTIELVKRSLDKGTKPFQILKYLQEGVKKVGELFESGEYYVGELIMAGIIFNEVLNLDVMKSSVSSNYSECIGTILLGTIENDIHDIGKDIFKSMALVEGFHVIDLGTDVKKEIFLKKTKELHPDIVGISGLITSAVNPISELIQLFESEGLRNQVKIIIGGNTMDEKTCHSVGADDFVHDAELGVQKCVSWIKQAR